MSEVELESTREKAKQPAKKRSFWLSRPAAILIIICFFFPLYTFSCGYSSPTLGSFSGSTITQYGVHTIFSSAVELNPGGVFRGSIYLLVTFLPVGALVRLFMSVTKSNIILTKLYGVFSIISSGIITLALIFSVKGYASFDIRWLSSSDRNSLMIIIFVAFVAMTRVYLSIVRSRNTKALRNYTLILLIFFTGLYGYSLMFHSDGYNGLEPAFYLIFFACISFLVSAYLAFKEGLPPDKPKRGEKRFI